ncbi:hypothetical protein LMG1231_05041 [Achromobacter denitrificans]|nr:hypothetical protein LMG1231_05041 [Achromobacter denitrificans]
MGARRDFQLHGRGFRALVLHAQGQPGRGARRHVPQPRQRGGVRPPGGRPGRDPGPGLPVRAPRRLPAAGRRDAPRRGRQPVRSVPAAEGATGLRGPVRSGAQTRAREAAPGDRRDHLPACRGAARRAVGPGPARPASARDHLSGARPGRGRGRPAGRAAAAGERARRSRHLAAGARRRQHRGSLELQRRGPRPPGGGQRDSRDLRRGA